MREVTRSSLLPIQAASSVVLDAVRRTIKGIAPRDVGLFVLANAVIQLAVLSLAAPAMIRVVRADGGTPTEYLVFVFYATALLLGVAWGTLALFAAVRSLGSRAVARAAVVAAEAAVSIAIAAEIITFTQLGLHPYGASTWAAVGTADVRNLPWWFVAVLVGLVGGLAVGEWVLLRGVTGLAQRLAGDGEGDLGIGKRCFTYALVGLVAFLAIDRDDAERVVPRGALPLYSMWIAPAGHYPDLRPRYRADDSWPAPTMARRPDIVVVVAESLRWDMLTPETMPTVTRFAEENGCLVAPRHYAGGHLTQYGAFSLLYGLGAWAFLPYMQESRTSWPLAVLRENGYELYGFDATGVLSYAIDPLVPDQFDHYQTTLRSDSTLLEETVRVLAEPHRPPRFAVTFLYTTHAPYWSPPDFQRYPIVRWSADIRAHAWTKYQNSAAYLDQLLGRLTGLLSERLRDGQAAVVITGDHGEEFWEFGLTGHASVGFHDVRTRVPMVLCLPGVSEPPAPISEHADVFPTILGWAGAGSPPVGLTSGRSMFAAVDSVPVVLAGAGFPGRAGGFALVTPQAKFWLQVEDPGFRNIELQQVTDLDDRPLPADDALRAALRAALASFHRIRDAVLRSD